MFLKIPPGLWGSPLCQRIRGWVDCSIFFLESVLAAIFFFGSWNVGQFWRWFAWRHQNCNIRSARRRKTRFSTKNRPKSPCPLPFLHRFDADSRCAIRIAIFDRRDVEKRDFRTKIEPKVHAPHHSCRDCIGPCSAAIPPAISMFHNVILTPVCSIIWFWHQYVP